MSPRDMISLALCGFDTKPTSPSDDVADAINIVGMTLEKALHEAELLRMATEATDDTLTAGSLWARLKALDWFITTYMDVSWKETGAEHSESEAAE